MENNRKFWWLIATLLGLMVISLLTGCSANTALCPAYDNHQPVVINGYAATY